MILHTIIFHEPGFVVPVGEGMGLFVPLGHVSKFFFVIVIQKETSTNIFTPF